MISRIIHNNLCLGCGLCASVLGEDKCKMQLNQAGFYIPEVGKKVKDNFIKYLCPGIRIHSDKHKGIWGNVVQVVEAWASNSKIRHKAASGGVVSSIAIYLLEQHKVNAILQVGVKEGDYLHNELKISRTKEEVMNNAQSRYAPALTLVHIKQILDQSDDSYAFVGKPCDIVAIRNFLDYYQQYQGRIRFLISIFCAGMPSYNASIKAWKMSGIEETPISLKYRGDGWPGNFKVIWKDGRNFQLSYSDSWGKILGRNLGFRCKICPDGIGMLADIAVGDSWNTENGYPNFTDSEGRCFVMVRSQRGKEITEKAKALGYINYMNLNINKIQEMQAYQYERRKIVGWRLFPVQLLTFGLLDFRGLGISKQAMSANFKKGIGNMKGTLKRFIKIIYS